MWTEAAHWRVFNVMARLFGLMLLLVAVVFLGGAAYFAVHPEAARNVETDGLPAAALYAGIGAMVGVIGAFVLTRQPYSPILETPLFPTQSAMNFWIAEYMDPIHPAPIRVE